MLPSILSILSVLAAASAPLPHAGSVPADNVPANNQAQNKPAVEISQQLAQSNTALLKQGQDCRAMANGKQRLACFDSIFDVAPNKAKKQAMSLEKTAPKSEVLAAKSTVPSSQHKQKETEGGGSARSQREDSFGSLHLQNQDTSEDELDRVTFVLEKVVKTARKRQMFYFTNGQVWENKTSQELRISTGDSVSIRDGALSAFYLSKLDGRRSVRVKRVR